MASTSNPCWARKTAFRPSPAAISRAFPPGKKRIFLFRKGLGSLPRAKSFFLNLLSQRSWSVFNALHSPSVGDYLLWNFKSLAILSGYYKLSFLCQGNGCFLAHPHFSNLHGVDKGRGSGRASWRGFIGRILSARAVTVPYPIEMSIEGRPNDLTSVRRALMKPRREA